MPTRRCADGSLDVYDCNPCAGQVGRDGTRALHQPAGHAQRTAELLPTAQLAIHAHGYNTPPPPAPLAGTLADTSDVTEPVGRGGTDEHHDKKRDNQRGHRRSRHQTG